MKINKRIPWNKGKKGLQTAWNKGITKDMDIKVKRIGMNSSKTKIKNKFNHSIESKSKISKNNSRYWKGKHISNETKEKLRECFINKKLSESHKENISINNSKYWKGKKRSNETRLKIRKSIIKYKNEIIGNIHPWFNIKACKFFEKLNKKFNINGQYAKNKGEFFIKNLGYWVDFYSKKYNLVIEWNEERGHYNNGKLTKKHKKRQNEIKKELNCIFINIREKSFKEERIFRKIGKIIYV